MNTLYIQNTSDGSRLFEIIGTYDRISSCDIKFLLSIGYNINLV